jgi:lipoyl(octanoyl) transferase
VTAPRTVVLRRLGRRPYRAVWTAMRDFTDRRDDATPDEVWLVEHPPVFTLGVNAAREHLLAPGEIEVVETDRGGQVTYHGPGQLVMYPLLDLRRYGLGPRSLVSLLERSTVRLLADFAIDAAARDDAPGVYVAGRKIASIGLRIRRGASYHGLALNVAMDLAPFARINPCGHADLAVTSLQAEGGPQETAAVGERLAAILLRELEAAGGTPASYIAPAGRCA